MRETRWTHGADFLRRSPRAARLLNFARLFLLSPPLFKKFCFLHGKVYVAGYEISKHPMKAFEHMGYCPQADTLWSVVTVKEHLQLFARVRGIPWGDVNRVVDQ